MDSTFSVSPGGELTGPWWFNDAPLEADREHSPQRGELIIGSQEPVAFESTLQTRVRFRL